MEIAQKSLINYENPPVIEVVCGILFKPIEAMLAPHFGLLWEKYKSDYPNCKELPPLTTTIERFDRPEEKQIEISNVPPLPRIWFIHKQESGIIQVQRDRFLHNWRKTYPEEKYPRYHTVIEMFKNHLFSFNSFLKENDLGSILPLQYEMTYVNHVPKGEGWETINEIGKVFPDFHFRSHDRFLPEPEGLNWRTSFILPNQQGRLHATIRKGWRRDTDRPILLLELTVRGIGSDKSLEGTWKWFDLAREWIVYGFSDLTGRGVQKTIWRKRD